MKTKQKGDNDMPELTSEILYNIMGGNKMNEIKKAKQSLIEAIEWVFECWNNESRTEEEREDEMLNLMSYYNNFEEIMTKNGFTVQECLEYTCREIGYIN